MGKNPTNTNLRNLTEAFPELFLSLDGKTFCTCLCSISIILRLVFFLWIINMTKNLVKIYIIKILKLWGVAIKNDREIRHLFGLRYPKIPFLWKTDNSGISQELGTFSWTIEEYKAATAPNYCQVRRLKRNSSIHLITKSYREDFSATG